jgi:CHAD domain-containing protein
MLKKKRLQKFLIKRCQNICDHLQVFCTTNDPEELHQLRVEIKKINALIFLLHTCSPKRTEACKFIKKIFKQAGRIRCAQVNIQMMAEYGLENASFEKEQKEVIANELQQFCAAAEHFQSKIIKEKKRLSEKLFGIKDKKVLCFYQNKVQEMGFYFSSAFNTDRLHDTRKELKILLYLLDILPKRLVKQLNLNKDYLHELQNAIGRWHDSEEVALMFTKQGFASETIQKVRQENTLHLAAVIALAQMFHKKIMGATTSAEA